MTISKLYDLVISIIFLFIFLNVNGIIYIFTSITALASVAILILLISGLLLLFFLPNATLPEGNSKLFIMTLIAYLFFGVIGFMVNDALDFYGNDDIALVTVKNIFIGIGFCIVFFNYFRTKLKADKFSNVINSYTFWLLLAGIIGLIFKLTGISEYGNYRAMSDGRFGGVFANPNELGFFSVVALIFLLHQSFRKDLRLYQQLSLVLGACLSILNIFLAMSKTSLATLLLVLLYYLSTIIIGNASTKKKVSISILTILISASSLFYIKQEFDSLTTSQQTRLLVFQRISETNEIEGETSGRTELWAHGIELIISRPIGYGLGYMRNMPGYGGVHQEFIMIAGEAGVIVSILVLILVVKVLLNIKKRIKDPSYRFLLISLLLALLGVASSTHGIIQKKGILLIVLLLMFCSSSRLSNERV